MNQKVKKIARGFAFYIVGIILGIFVVKFFFKNRDVPSMWPEGRVKQMISESEWIPNGNGECFKACYGLSDSAIVAIVKNGNVRFGVSKTRREPLPVYIIDGQMDEKLIRIHIESGDTTASLFGIEDLPETKITTVCNCELVPY